MNEANGTERLNNCLGEETKFGAYSVVLKSGRGLDESVRGGLGLTDEDVYLEVHVPESVEGAPRAVLAVFKEGAVALADFLVEKRLSPRCLIGITHQNVAAPARHSPVRRARREPRRRPPLASLRRPPARSAAASRCCSVGSP